MTLSRRRLLHAAALGATLGWPAAGAERAGATTVDRTLRPGLPGPGGYARIVTGPGERHVVRTALGARAQTGRANRRRAILTFGQVSDLHVVDAQSPLRVEYLDRYGDGSSGTDIVRSAYRPQEMLTAQVAEAMVRALNDVRVGPVTGTPLRVTVQTGDNSDNAQFNEVRWNIDLLDGRTVRPDSGDLTRCEGVADDDPVYYDTHYWHPHGTPALREDDLARSVYGFPVAEGLLDAARRQFRTTGLATPWLTAFGNHDGLWQGNFPDATLDGDVVATGSLKLVSLPPGVSQDDVLSAISSGSYARLLKSLGGSPYVRPVTPDPDRRLLSRADWIAEHFRTAGAPIGHGLTVRNRRTTTAYYTYVIGRLCFVVLDTVNPNGESGGSLDEEQFRWLQRVLARTTRHAIVVVSHHTSTTMDNTLVATGGDSSARVTGDQVVAELLGHRRVIAWVNGHTHRHEITAHRRPNRRGGFWEINTASHIDFPQQARVLEVADNRDGSWSMFTTVVDHSGPAAYGGRLGGPVPLAGLCRELGANDWQERGSGGGDRRGDHGDRNVELLLPAPLLG